MYMNREAVKKAILGSGYTHVSDIKCPSCGAAKLTLKYVSGMRRIDANCGICDYEVQLGGVDAKPNIAGILER